MKEMSEQEFITSSPTSTTTTTDNTTNSTNPTNTTNTTNTTNATTTTTTTTPTTEEGNSQAEESRVQDEQNQPPSHSFTFSTSYSSSSPHTFSSSHSSGPNFVPFGGGHQFFF